MKRYAPLVGLASSLLLIAAGPAEQPAAPITFPTGYESTYTNYLSLDRVQNPDQVIRLFANDTALAGPDADGKLAFGSIIVAEVYKARKDAEGHVMESKLGRRIRDDLVLIAVMQRERGWGADLPANLRNEHWDFAAFAPDGSLAKKDINACRECHAPLTETHHLFSIEHLIPAH
ncbi:MAG: cytochrome P460 family protein [Acidobacteriota bacterium]